LLPGTELYDRSTTSDANGNFTLPALAAGYYTVQPVEQVHDVLLGNYIRPLSAPFAPRKVTIRKGETPGPMVFHPLPSVTVEARVVDSKGKPRKDLASWLSVSGELPPENPGKPRDPLELPNLTSWSGKGWPDATGKVVFHVPRGMWLPSLNLVTLPSEGHVFRSRLGKDAPLRDGSMLNLVPPPRVEANPPSLTYESLDHDIKTIEVVVYESPVVLVKVVASDGSKPRDIQVTADYAHVKVADPESVLPDEDADRVVRFTEENDGRYRSGSVFPDEEVTVTARAKGFAPKSATLTLPEGSTRSLELVLDRE